MGSGSSRATSSRGESPAGEKRERERSASTGHRRVGSGSPSPYRGGEGDVHPAYRDHHGSQGDLGSGRGRGMYAHGSNESESGLLRSGQGMGTSTPEEGEGRETYGLDRWRTGGSGYVGLPAREDDGVTGYDYYRGRR